jgi:hypothetical protein
VAKRAWLTGVYELAQRSVALPVASASPAIATFRLRLQNFLDLSRQRVTLEHWADTLLGEHADYHLLQTIPGIGPVFALTILAEAGDLRRFTHHRQFLTFCGFDLAKSQSGASRGREQLSKRGNSACGVPSGLLAGQPSAVGSTPSGTSLSAISRPNPAAPIGDARPTRPSPPRWRPPPMPSSRQVIPIAVTSSTTPPWIDPVQSGRRGACDLVDKVRTFHGALMPCEEQGAQRPCGR